MFFPSGVTLTIERTGEAGFLLEALHQLRVRGQGLADDLERDVSTEARVPCPVDLRHSPGPDGREDLVMTPLGASGQAHGDLTYRRRPSGEATLGGRARLQARKRLPGEADPLGREPLGAEAVDDRGRPCL